MACEILSGISSFSDFLVYPVTCNFYFYLIILGFFFILLSWFLFKGQDLANESRGDMIGSLAISSITVSVLGGIGTLIKNGENIAMVHVDIMLYILAATAVFVLIWIFKD